MEDTARNISFNIYNLRKKQGLSQVELAKMAEIPRSTLTYLESGESNPTLQNVLKVASALQVGIEEMISAPFEQYKIHKSNEIPVKAKSGGNIRIKKLLPDPIPGMEIDHMTLKPGSRMKGTPHIKNTKEYLYCEKGEMTIYTNRQSYLVKEGELFSFPGDTAHAYVNEHKAKTTICFSVVVFAPITL